MTGNDYLALAHWDVVYLSFATIIVIDQITKLVWVTRPIDGMSVDVAFGTLVRILVRILQGVYPCYVGFIPRVDIQCGSCMSITEAGTIASVNGSKSRRHPIVTQI